jgi:hypothetical protein
VPQQQLLDEREDGGDPAPRLGDGMPPTLTTCWPRADVRAALEHERGHRVPGHRGGRLPIDRQLGAQAEASLFDSIASGQLEGREPG